MEVYLQHVPGFVGDPHLDRGMIGNDGAAETTQEVLYCCGFFWTWTTKLGEGALKEYSCKAVSSSTLYFEFDAQKPYWLNSSTLSKNALLNPSGPA